ncbi:MAG: signal peptide peptidase SppA [Planctomycetota bacterium]|nr:signal peptide peptidase SppA [Planctomycetota bacterium]
MSPSPNDPNLPGGYPVATRADVPMRVILEQGRFGRFGARLPWILLGIAVLVIFSLYSKYSSYIQPNPQIEEKFHSLNLTATDKVAIISVEGAIMHNEGFAKWQIDQVAKDENVKAVVLRIDSPGGTITGSDYLYHHLIRMTAEKKIPLVVSMGGLAASGGYYIAMAVGSEPETIYAEPTTWTGSIGVIIPHYDISALLEKWDIQDDSIASNPLKMMGSPTRKQSPEIEAKEKEILRQLVEQSFNDFKDIIRKGRPKLANDNEAMDKISTGQIFTAKQAKDLGLVDQLGFIEDAIGHAVKLAGLNPDEVRCVKYVRPRGLLTDVMEGPSSQSQSLNLSGLLDLTAPRAYYLCTWLPAIITNRSVGN